MYMTFFVRNGSPLVIRHRFVTRPRICPSAEQTAAQQQIQREQPQALQAQLQQVPVSDAEAQQALSNWQAKNLNERMANALGSALAEFELRRQALATAQEAELERLPRPPPAPGARGGSLVAQLSDSISAAGRTAALVARSGPVQEATAAYNEAMRRVQALAQEAAAKVQQLSR